MVRAISGVPKNASRSRRSGSLTVSMTAPPLRGGAAAEAVSYASARCSASFFSFFFTMVCFSRESRSTKSTPSR